MTAMFANRLEIIRAVLEDPVASPAEKDFVIGAVCGGAKCAIGEARVITFRHAQHLLGYKSTRAVHAAVRAGVLKGYYGGKMGRRASGVLYSSVLEVMESGQRSWGSSAPRAGAAGSE